MKSKALQINIFEKRALTALVVLVFILLGFYGYFISKSIVNVIVREEINNDVVAVSSAISELEFEYIAHKNTINKEYAKAVGFKNISTKTFVARKSFAKLSLEN
ncbi:MAG: hypothetical protein ISR98_00615 [Parcubacteria group bacterium]|nr:hypothetical protein [Parcubacteria group bacterium]